mgnify:CR=1 FL=1
MAFRWTSKINYVDEEARYRSLREKFKELNTFPKLLKWRARKYPNKVALRKKKYGIWWEKTWSQFYDEVRKVAGGLAVLGVRRGDVVVIIGHNDPEWIYAELGAQILGAIPLGIYPDSLPNEISYFINFVNAKVVVVEDQEQVEKILSVIDEVPDVEKIIYFGSRIEPGAADIVVYHEDLQHYYILFEVKRPSRTAGLEQLKSYCNAEGTPIGVWSNGNEIIRLHREEPNLFVEIPRIPKVSETLRDILTERWTLQWLEEHDELKQGKTTLKKILLDLEELVLGNAGVDPFEEIFKLIYAKLYDEWKGINNPNYQLEFFVGDRSPQQVKRAITNLLEGAKRTWSGVFEPTDRIELRDDHLKVCVSFLEKIKLFNSNLRIIDEAFEYLIPQVSKKKEGQFFTPRPVEDMIVKMLNPKPDEFVIDPACGSAGFLLHSVMWVAGGVISGRPLPPAAQNFAQNNIYGIDFAKKPVKIAKAINLIVGDGKSHVYKDNSLAPQTWSDETKAGLRPRLLRFPDNLEKDRENQNKFLYFDFDILMTNPPFAGTVKERDILRLYKLAEKNGKLVRKIGRHILFLERSLQFIRPGGRMAIILPQGLLNNTNAEYIRRFVIEEARIYGISVEVPYNFEFDKLSPFRSKLILIHPKVINLCGKTTLKELIYVIKKLDILITPDSAPLHMGIALGIPVIGLFGPTDPFRHIEKQENLFVIFKKLDCSFCYRHKCKKKECMRRISPQEVFKMIKKILKK